MPPLFKRVKQYKGGALLMRLSSSKKRQLAEEADAEAEGMVEDAAEAHRIRRASFPDILECGPHASNPLGPSTCCAGCMAVARGTKRFIVPGDWDPSGALRFVAALRAELSAHGADATGNKDALVSRLRALVPRRAFYISEVAAVAATIPATPTPPTAPDPPSTPPTGLRGGHSRTSPDSFRRTFRSLPKTR